MKKQTVKRALKVCTFTRTAPFFQTGTSYQKIGSGKFRLITTEHKSKAMEIFAVPENESNIIELTA